MPVYTCLAKNFCLLDLYNWTIFNGIVVTIFFCIQMGKQSCRNSYPCPSSSYKSIIIILCIMYRVNIQKSYESCQHNMYVEATWSLQHDLASQEQRQEWDGAVELPWLQLLQQHRLMSVRRYQRAASAFFWWSLKLAAQQSSLHANEWNFNCVFSESDILFIVHL